MSKSTEHPIANPTTAIFFHGRFLIPYSTGNQKYIPIRPIVDLIGNDWRTVRRTITKGDNQDLYGTITLTVPKIDNLGGLMPTQTGLSTPSQDDLGKENTQNSDLIDILCIRFDRVHMFLARVNTTRLRVNGNIESADYLLQLQHEWADVLHDYETHGIAIKNTLFENIKQLKLLTDVYHKLNDTQQKQVVSKQIDACLGINRAEDKDQADLFA